MAQSALAIMRLLLKILMLIVGVGLFGWGLSAFAAPTVIWVGTGLVMIYLFWVGKGGIFPASAWVTVLMTLAIALDVFPAFWPEQLHYRFWARSLIGLWAGAIGIVWLLGSYGPILKSVILDSSALLRSAGLLGQVERWFKSSKLSQWQRLPRTPADLLNDMAPDVRDNLTQSQRVEIERILDLAVPKPAPKLVDLRFDIDLIISRFYIVLFVGKDRRKTDRPQDVSWLTTLSNWVAAMALLIGVNLAVSISLLLLAYLVKSALGINLIPGHFRGFVK